VHAVPPVAALRPHIRVAIVSAETASIEVVELVVMALAVRIP
jgi:hypothetical protein